jgi:arginyl-tRNA synthetase
MSFDLVTRQTLHRQLEASLNGESSTRFWVRQAQNSQHGEFVSNLVLVVAARTKQPVAQVAQRLIEQLSWMGSLEERKGFLNFRMNDETLRSTVEAALAQGEGFGAGSSLQNRRVIVEFVSADPSGPLPFALSRMAAVGDAICRLLALQGAGVTREFYLNDDETSAKTKLLGESVASHYLTILGQPHEPPEGMLDDAFVRSLAEQIAQRDGSAHLLMSDEERAARFAHQAVESAVQMQKNALNRFGVRFDVWTSEAALKRENRVENAIAKLREGGLLYERDGAQWLQTSKFGDEADRVLVRANGRPTYLASDIAYHVFKAERGFDLLLNIWTGEHRPYVERTRAALASAGCDAEKFEVTPCEGARFLKDGRPVSRGKSGGAWSLEDALDELDGDTLKFFLLRQNADERVAIDDEIARRDDETNPAYAARLLPSRLQTMIAQMQAMPQAMPNASAESDNADIEYSNEEREVVRLVALWPDTAENAALERAPHRVAAFLSDMSQAVRDVLKTSRPNAPAASIDVLKAALVVSQNALHVLGMSGAKV